MTTRPVRTPKPWQRFNRKIDVFDIAAVHALAAGQANEGQQRAAWRIIVEELCDTDKMSFWPGEDGRRASDFAEGKRWVGTTLRAMSRAEFAIDIHGAPPPLPGDAHED